MNLDVLQPLQRLPLDELVKQVHVAVRADVPSVSRIAVAIYDPGTDLLKTYAHSTVDAVPLTHYEAKLSQVPSLLHLAENRKARVLDNLKSLSHHSRHAEVIHGQFASSFTRPLFHGTSLLGFVFFDSFHPNCFANGVVDRLNVFSEFIELIIESNRMPERMLKSLVHIASEVCQVRDPETGAHLERMSRFARLVAQGIAEKHNLSDTYVEHIFLFSPIHDVGKVGVPDEILLKPGRFTPHEFSLMKRHTTHGFKVVQRILKELALDESPSLQMLSNIVLFHHESWDGQGYPNGLRGETIPLEARIVAVADVFDALTSDRVYKKAWTNEATFDHMLNNAGVKFDPDCVKALVAAKDKIAEIQRLFRDEIRRVRVDSESTESEARAVEAKPPTGVS